MSEVILLVVLNGSYRRMNPHCSNSSSTVEKAPLSLHPDALTSSWRVIPIPLVARAVTTAIWLADFLNKALYKSLNSSFSSALSAKTAGRCSVPDFRFIHHRQIIRYSTHNHIAFCYLFSAVAEVVSLEVFFAFVQSEWFYNQMMGQSVMQATTVANQVVDHPGCG